MKTLTTLEEHLNKKYSVIGTPQRNRFEKKSKSFTARELLKAVHKQK